MKNNEDQTNCEILKGYVIIFFAVLLLWQLYQVSIMLRLTPALKDSLYNLGMPAPGITKLYLSIYKWLPILPVITILLAVDLIRRKPIPKYYSIMGFGSMLLVTLLVQFFIVEAFYTPYFQIMKKI